MSAAVVPFPLCRRRAFVRRQARWFCEQNQRSAETNLHRQLMLQRDTLLAKGVDPLVVEIEVRKLDVAIRCEASLLLHAPEAG